MPPDSGGPERLPAFWCGGRGGVHCVQAALLRHPVGSIRKIPFLRFLLGTRSLGSRPCALSWEGDPARLSHVWATLCFPWPQQVLSAQDVGTGQLRLGSSLEGRALALAPSSAPVAGGGGSVLRPSCRTEAVLGGLCPSLSQDRETFIFLF